MKKIIALILLWSTVGVLAQETPTLDNAYTSSAQITLFFPDGFTAQEDAEGEFIALTNAEATTQYAFVTGNASESIFGDRLPDDVLDAYTVVESALQQSGINFDQSEKGQFNINDLPAIGATFTQTNGIGGALIVFTLENGATAMTIVTSRDTAFVPDLVLLILITDAITTQPQPESTPEFEGLSAEEMPQDALIFTDTLTGKTSQIVIPEDWIMDNLEQIVTDSATLYYEKDETKATFVYILDFGAGFDVTAYSENVLPVYANMAGDETFDYTVDFEVTSLLDERELQIYRSIDKLEPLDGDTPLVYIMLVQLDTDHSGLIVAQTTENTQPENFVRDINTIIQSFALRD